MKVLDSPVIIRRTLEFETVLSPWSIRLARRFCRSLYLKGLCILYPEKHTSTTSALGVVCCSFRIFHDSDHQTFEPGPHSFSRSGYHTSSSVARDFKCLPNLHRKDSRQTLWVLLSQKRQRNGAECNPVQHGECRKTKFLRELVRYIPRVTILREVNCYLKWSLVRLYGT